MASAITLKHNGRSSPPVRQGAKGTALAGRRRRDIRRGDAGLFGQHLESLVVKAKMTPEQFAVAIGKNRDTVTLYFGGHRLPKLADFRRIASVLGLKSIRELVPDLPATPVKKKPKKSP